MLWQDTIQVAWNNQISGFFIGQLYTYTQLIWMLTVWIIKDQLLHLSQSALISGTLFLSYDISVYPLRGSSKQVPGTVWNKGIPDCKLALTLAEFILIQRGQYITKHLISLTISDLSRFQIIIQLSRFKITCLTDIFTINVIILINRLYW